MQSLFKKSLLVVAIAANGTIIAEGGIRQTLCGWFGCNSSATTAPSTAAASAATLAKEAASQAAVTASTASASAASAATAAQEAAAQLATNISQDTAPKAVATPGLFARMLACISAGTATAWSYSLGSVWNLTTEMNNPFVNKFTPQCYANFVKANPYRLATIIRSAAKLGIAAGVSYGAYVAYKKLFAVATVKKAKNKVTATVTPEEPKAPSKALPLRTAPLVKS